MGLVALRHVGSSGAGLKPVSPALAGGFLTTVPPGKPCLVFFESVLIVSVFIGICPFHLRYLIYLIYWHTIVHTIILLQSFLFL